MLDAVRGMAVVGILHANLMSFFGADMLDDAARRALPFSAAGDAVLFAIDWLVEGKFYSVFSMLLGAGFALQATIAAREGRQGFPAFFRRRMIVLVAIGAGHMFGLWSGDILMLYGLLGLLLPWLWRWPPRARLTLMAGLFAMPLATHGVVLATAGRADPRPPFAAAGAALRERWGIADRSTLDVFARGSSAEYYAWNTANAVVRPGTYLQSGRPEKVLALFLLGAWLASTTLSSLHAQRAALWRTVAIGGGIGLAGSFVYASIKAATRSTFLLSGTGLLQTAAYTLGTTPLALAYLAAAALAWQHPVGQRVLGWFVPIGRMALSAYVSQSVVQLLLFSSHGARLAGRVPFVWLPVVAAGIIVGQRVICAWWLRGHQQGPLEWIWRHLAYGTATASAR
ncbi:MAG: DUF418 domain-containing protein [Vicinamibacterales bacterium]